MAGERMSQKDPVKNYSDEKESKFLKKVWGLKEQDTKLV